MKARHIVWVLAASLSLIFLTPPLTSQADAKKRSKNPDRPSAARKLKKKRQSAVISGRKTSDNRKQVALTQKEVKPLRGVFGGEEQMWRERAYPNNFIDPTASAHAITQRNRLPIARLGFIPKGGIGVQSLFPSAKWEFVGPINWYPTVQRPYYGPETMNGRVRDIAVHPTNRLILYVASAQGGVFKSTDGGITWTPQSNSWPYLITNTLAINPQTPNIVYAGTGTSPIGAGQAIGLMKTTDGGATWINLNTPFVGQSVAKILLAPTNRVVVLTGDREGGSIGGTLWYSPDGGVTWSDVNNTPNFINFTDGVIAKSGYLFAVGSVTGYGPSVLMRSTNQGATWTPLPNFPNPVAFPWVRITASKVDNNTLYAGFANHDPRQFKLYKSVNNGDAWTDITASSGANNTSIQENTRQAFIHFHLNCSSRTVSGVARDVLYLGLINAYQQVQTPGNTIWKNIGDTEGDDANMHADQLVVAFDPTNPDKGWFGNDGGVYSFYNNPTTNTTVFQSLNNGLQMTLFYHADYHPADPSIMLAGAQDNGAAVALGDVNTWAMATAGDAFYVAINPQNPSHQYSTYTFGTITRSDDLWVSSYDVSPNRTASGVGTMAFVTPIAIDPANPKYLYTAGERLARYDSTQPAATAWTYFPTNLATDGNYATRVAVASNNSARIYVATIDGKLWTTGDGGANWKLLKAGVNNEALPNRNVGGILSDPADSRAVYVGLMGTGISDHLYYCPDVTVANPVWQSKSGVQAATKLPDSSLNTIAVDPWNVDLIYVGTDIGVFQSTNFGQTWSNATAPLGLPNVQVNDLKTMPQQSYLYAATWGRGIYRVRLINNDPVAGLLFNPAQVRGGGSITGTVYLGTLAPAGGKVVTLSSSNPSVANVPASVTVPAGSNFGTFAITTTTVGIQTSVNITASVSPTAPGTSKTGRITVLSGQSAPILTNFTIDGGTGIGLPIGASTTSTGVVTISRAATTPLTVTIVSSSNAATVPATVVIPAGQTSAQFSLQLNVAAAAEVTRISAQLGGIRRTVTVYRD